jgi:hypothetical protein
MRNLREATSQEALVEAVREFQSLWADPRYREFETYVCHQSNLIIRLRSTPFILRTKSQPWLVWTPALYALTCVCGQIVAPCVSLGTWDELRRELARLDLDLLEIECMHELERLEGERVKTAAQAGDRAAYRPATEILAASSFPTYKALRAYLDKHPEIRTLKPSKQRLLVHAGDWMRCCSRQDDTAFEALDESPEAVAAFLEEAEARQEAIRRRKAGR